MNGPLPSFLVIGAMKAGTTSLHHYLDAHPDLYLPGTKELNFFRDERSFARGEGWYRRQFAGAAPHQIAGEVSPDYSKHPHHRGAPERIAGLIPDARLVYLLRHPVDRMLSMYLHQLVAGRETRPADVALVEDPHYLEVSCYGMQLERYLDHFHLEQMLVLTSEALAADRGTVMAQIHRFVGVDPLPGTATAVDGTWYRGETRRRRGLLARAAAGSDVARRAFGRLPAPVQHAVRRAGSRPVDPGSRLLSAPAERAVVDLLRPDLERLHRYAPDGVRSWGLLEGAPAVEPPPTTDEHEHEHGGHA